MHQDPLQPIPNTSQDNFLCAVSGVKELQSDEVCAADKSCLTVNYIKKRICALEGSSVNISSKYSSSKYTKSKAKHWSRIIWNGEKEERMNVLKTDHFTYHEDQEKQINTLSIKSVKKSDSAEYRFMHQDDNTSQKPGTVLIVTDIKVKISPSTEVTEGDRVKLTCSTSCPLTNNKNYIWYLNDQLLQLPEHQNKHLVLDAVTTQHAGIYSCAVNTQRDVRSPEKTLRVQSSSLMIGSSILDQINGSLVTGYVPRSYKVAVIKSLLKKPSLDPDVLANYRPISNLPFISKVLEKVVVTQLLQHLQRNSLFEMFQSGFRAHHSTETALLKVTNDLLIASDHGLVSMLVLLDLSAAFDTVDHSILLQRLEYVIGIEGTALDWFRSYLSDRYQFAHVHGVPSSYSRVSHGVPQDSVLGPILFTLYMLPLGNIIRQHGINFHCYADDTQLYLSIKPEKTDKLVTLQTCLKDIKSWMSSNFLLLNPGKTEVMVFGPEPLWDRLDHMITLDGISLTSSLSVRNLGVTFDQNLSFNSHIKLVS
uniref:Reverse transcriptase domain-containing protein n=1 Tax=Takifugu rubripes TaxID=31033 RepID=A0A674PNC8_TAKRU